MRFMHVADVHLGYQQYGSRDRFYDFCQVFLTIVERAIEQQVDFILLAGDLFEKRTVDPESMRVAIEGLRLLREAGIPVVAVEGNHERAYHREYSWLDFLDSLDYLYLLNPRFEDGRAVLEPYGEAGGAYLDLSLTGVKDKPGGVRIYGLKYYGASTGKVFGLFADALAKMDHNDVDFSILVSHAGLEGQLPRYSGTLTHNDLAPLRERLSCPLSSGQRTEGGPTTGHINYLALGHIHKSYAVDGWIYNPGSPETWSIEEVAWPERGYYLVEIQPGNDPDHQADLVITPRRPFHRFRLEVDALTDPNSVYDAVRTLLKREGDKVSRDPASVVELTLSGVLPFSRYDLDLDYVKGLLEDTWSPVVTRVRNMTTPAEFEVAIDVEASRPELERCIVRELLERDARFRPAAKDWTRVALDVKRLALEGSTPEVMIDYLRRSRAELILTS